MTQAPSLTVEADLAMDVDRAIDRAIDPSTAALTPFLFEEHRRSKRRECLTALVATLHESLVLIDTEGSVIAASDPWMRLMRNPRQDSGSLMAQCQSRFGSRAAERLRHGVRQAARLGATHTVELPLEHDTRTITVTCSPS